MNESIQFVPIHFWHPYFSEFSNIIRMLNKSKIVLICSAYVHRQRLMR